MVLPMKSATGTCSETLIMQQQECVCIIRIFFSGPNMRVCVCVCVYIQDYMKLKQIFESQDGCSIMD